MFRVLYIIASSSKHWKSITLAFDGIREIFFAINIDWALRSETRNRKIWQQQWDENFPLLHFVEVISWKSFRSRFLLLSFPHPQPCIPFIRSTSFTTFLSSSTSTASLVFPTTTIMRYVICCSYTQPQDETFKKVHAFISRSLQNTFGHTLT